MPIRRKEQNGSTQYEGGIKVENGTCKCGSDIDNRSTVPYYPDWFPINDHLGMYQRRPTPQFWSCMKTVCERNSECACTWSHLICLLVTIQALLVFMQKPNEHFVQPEEERCLFTFSLICGCLCFGCSTLFHTFYCHSQRYFEGTLKLDLLGIVVGTQGAWHPWIYYTFYCERHLWFICTLATATFGIVSSWLLTRSYLLRECMAKKRAIISGSIFILVLPIYSTIFFRDGFVEALVNGHQCWGIIAIAIGSVGVTIYCSKVPESLSSGWYDSIITSHVIFHICAAFCFWLSVYMCLLLQEQRFQLGDTCYQ